ncbi:MAG TPA: LysM peptidoglycan-binding domain-containing protein [Spirochaetota bacterium]|nr:LysM peptidoglycan-binding domain-containing protein [Spirochaetota bacterium]HPH01549.1 LysM peptidoglycan-binding domain-containing protein [Spirochaetota bacterium]
MKKSDIAIYVSAILTLVLTTFVVFSTQKVTYENQADEVLKNNNLATNQFAMASDPDTSSDANSPLFRNRVADGSSDDIKTEQGSEDGKKAADIRDVSDDTAGKKADETDDTRTRATETDTHKKEAKTPVRPDTKAADESFADTTLPRQTTPATKSTGSQNDLFDDEAPTTTVRKPAPSTTRDVLDVPARTPAKKAAAPSIETSSGKKHVVQYGEMLRSIAARNGTTTTKLIQLNNISNPDLIYPGQIIRLP